MKLPIHTMSSQTKQLLETNETDANRFTIRCLCGMEVILIVNCVLAALHIFDLELKVALQFALLGLICKAIPVIIVMVFHDNRPYVKYIILFQLLFLNLALTSYYGYHVTLLFVVPIILVCHYYSDRFVIIAYFGTVLAFVYGMCNGFQHCYGEFANLEYLYSDGSSLIRFSERYILPAVLQYTVLFPVCLTLVNRSRKMLVDQANTSAAQQKIKTELDISTTIQASLLPAIFPAFPDYDEFDLYASMRPAKEVGGDFYDMFLVDDAHLALVIADVSGKGIPAALFIMISKTLIKDSAIAGNSPSRIFEQVNSRLSSSNQAEMFVTCWIGILEIKTGHLVCGNAGHEYPILKRNGGSFEVYKDRHDFVLAGMAEATYHEYELDLNAGDTLFVYTDGVTEAADSSSQLYGLDRTINALNRIIEENPDTSMKDLSSSLKQDIDHFVGNAEQFDDITMLALRMTPIGSHPSKKDKQI